MPSTTLMTKTSSPEAETSNSFVERWLLAPKLIFFCIGAIKCCMGSSILRNGYTNWGLDMCESSPSGLVHIASIIGTLVLSKIADKSKMYRYTMAVCVIGYALLVLAMGFPSVPLSINPSSRFMLFQLLQALQQIFLAGFYPIANALVLNKLSSKSKDSYGRQRMFAPLGYLSSVLFYRALLYFYELKEFDFIVYLRVLVFLSVLFLVALIIFKCSEMRDQPDKNFEIIEKPNSQVSLYPQYSNQPATIVQKNESNSVSPFKKVFTDPKFFILFIAFIIAGFNGAYVKLSYIYLIVKLTSVNYFRIDTLYDIGSFCLIGLAEASVYFFDERITQALGDSWMMAIGYALLILRTLAFTFMTKESINMTLFISYLTQGITTGLISLSAVHFASELAAGATSATAQSIFDVPLSSLAIFLTLLFMNFYGHGRSGSISVAYIVISIIGAITLIPVMFLDKIFPKKSSQKTSFV